MIETQMSWTWRRVMICIGMVVVMPVVAMSRAEATPKIDDLPTPVGAADDWPWFGGPAGNNLAQADQKLPLYWSQTRNVLWKINLPGQGHATPCLQGKRLFVPAGDKSEKAIWMFCLDRDTGDQLWKKEVYQGPMAKIHKDNSYASATPACDGKRIFFPYQTDQEIRMVAMTLEGDIAWDKAIATYTSIQGFSASPIFYKAAVIVPTDGTGNNKLTALHRDTGQIIWQTDVPSEQENYASATLLYVAKRHQIILVGPDHIRSYDPDTGKMIWVCHGPAKCYVATAMADDTTVYATGGYPGKAMLAIRADGTGNVTETHVTWKSDKKASYVPTPLLHDGLIYVVNDQGLYRCYQAETGQVLNEKPLKGKYYSSPVKAGDRIYLFDKKGKGYILKADQSLETLAENDLPYGAFAAPVICNNRIYLRTLKTLYCLGQR